MSGSGSTTWRRRSRGSSAQGVRFAPGGIRKGAAGHDIAFIHPKGNAEAPIGGEGVLIELVQAPPERIAAARAMSVTPIVRTSRLLYSRIADRVAPDQHRASPRFQCGSS